jgi:hypothetical protein
MMRLAVTILISLALEAQPAEKVYRIGFLRPGSAAAESNAPLVREKD